MSFKKLSIMLLSAVSLAALMSGCGSTNKEGSINLGDVAKVDEASCAQCHGSAREKLTGRVIYDDYSQSLHLVKGVGCQDCHGGGAQHNGVGPIPYPSPSYVQCQKCHDDASDKLVTNYLGSKHFNVQIENEEGAPCQRCHTHQGAVQATLAGSGFTGDGTVMAALQNAPGLIVNPEPIKCTTCHITHRTDKLRVDPTWAPSTVAGSASNNGNDQYRLCTQCHTYINPAGKVAGSGTAASGTALVGHHETSWYRAIATTHYDNPATPAIEGYGVRTTGDNPCFDCHGHESMTNSNNDPASSSYDATKTTIYTDWAQSAHAGGLLTAKYAAAAANPVNAALSRTDPVKVAQGLAQVDAVMAANISSGNAWSANRQGSQNCVRCHSATGFKDYLTTADVTANTVGVPQTQVLTCWGCHSNPANGTLRTLAGTKATTNYTTDLGHTPVATLQATGYALSYGKKPFPDVAGSNLCIVCHDGRTGDPASQTTNYNTGAAITTPGGPHDMPAAATMYVKMGFLNLSTGGAAQSSAAYRKTLMSDQDGGSVTSTHRKLGTPGMNGDSHNPTFFVKGNLDSNGPCVTCHMTGSHSLKIDQKAITAVCNKCHTSEGGNDITTIAAFNQHFIEPQSEVFQNAMGLAYRAFNAKQTAITYAKSTSGSWSAYSNSAADVPASGTTLAKLHYTAANYASYLAGANTLISAGASDWAAAGITYGNTTKLFGAIGNVKLFTNDAASYAHARTYTRRLLYDSIDFLDDGVLNMSVSATAVAIDPVMYVKGTSTTAGGTTESMIYLLNYDRTSGAWKSPERP